MTTSSPVITQEFEAALDKIHEMVKSRRPSKALAILGSGGTGKTTLLKILKAQNPETVVIAPTGVAAVNAGGTTIHRLFNFPIKVLEPELDRENSHPSPVLRSLKLLVIDEAGMVRADLVDGIDHYLRRAKRRSTPFGGVPVVFIGDPAQLPPVVRREDQPIMSHLGYASPYFFGAKVWDSFDLDRVELTQVFRQADVKLVETLQRLRLGCQTDADLEYLNSRVLPPPGGTQTPILTTRRAHAQKLNDEALAALPGPLQTWKAEVVGNMKPEDCPADPLLQLKKDALVMLLNNTDDWQNGSLGVYRGINKAKLLEVDLNDGRRVSVDTHKWERFSYVLNNGKIEQKKNGSIEQYPVKLAHSITIHKAQGATLDRAVIDLGEGAFAEGQTYVALSRVRSIDGLYLSRPIRHEDCLVSDEVLDFLHSPKPDLRLELEQTGLQHQLF